MTTIQEILLRAPTNYVLKKDFFKWKKYLRKYDITCDVVNLLDGIPQSTHYHPEFDALLHTFFVCCAVVDIGRIDLLETSFLHDVGKGMQTTIGKNRIYHFGHPQSSVEFIENIKYKLANYDLVKQITNNHMKYNVGHKSLKNDNDLSDFIFADKVVSKRLYIEQSSKFELFLNKLKEKNVYRKQRKSKKILKIMVGIPGTGKSRYLRYVDKNLIVSSDDIRRELYGDVSIQKTEHIPAKEVWKTVSVRLRSILNLYGIAYMDSTNVHKFRRVEFMSGFNDCKKIAIVFEADPEVCKKRIRYDINSGKDRSEVPDNVVDKMYKLFKQGKKSLQNEFNEVIYYQDLVDGFAKKNNNWRNILYFDDYSYK